VVDVHQARSVDRPQITELLLRVFVVVRALEVGLGSGGERDARTVGDHVPDGGAVFAMAGVGRDVFADPIIEGELAAFDEHVHDRRGDRLGRRVDAERCIGFDRDLLGVRRVGRSIAPAVPDRPVQHDLAVVSQAHLDRRMHAGLIPVAGGFPDPLDDPRVDPGVVLVADRGYRVEVFWHPDSALRVVHAVRVRGAASAELSTVGRLSTGRHFSVGFCRLNSLKFEHAF
jgi:hypothetical protein